MVVPFAAVTARLVRALDRSNGRWRASSILFGALLAASFLSFFLGIIPIIGLYLGIWISSLLSFGALNRFAKRSLFIANAIALCLVLSCSLLLFGYLSMLEVTGSEADILVGAAGRLTIVQMLLAASLLLACVLVYALARGLDGAYPATERGDRALVHFHAFACFGIVYELLDLVPFSLDTWFAFMPYFLFGGSIILMLFFAVFSLSITYLGAEAFRESENITLERRKRDEELRMRLYQKAAAVDPLTGLNVRRIGHEHLVHLEKNGTPYLVAFIDLNNLKTINDEFGHAAGDICLQEFAQSLSRAFPDEDVVRWGGDEFLIIAESECASSLEPRLDALCTEVRTPKETISLQFCYGTASSELGDSDVVLRHADDAMYRRKHEIHRATSEAEAK